MSRRARTWHAAASTTSGGQGCWTGVEERRENLSSKYTAVVVYSTLSPARRLSAWDWELGAPH